MPGGTEYPVSELLEAALVALQNAWPVLRLGEPCPFDNSGARFDGPGFQVHAYCWGEADQPWNFKWRDLEVRWYKYLGRGMGANRDIEDAEVSLLLAECLRYLMPAQAGGPA